MTLMDFGQATFSFCVWAAVRRCAARMAIAELGMRNRWCFYSNVIALTIARLAAYLQVRVQSGDLADRGLRTGGDCSSRHVPGVAVPAVCFPGRPRTYGERIAQVVESATRMFLGGYKLKAGVMTN